jgi:vacuolar protein sorting-associated protein 26
VWLRGQGAVQHEARVLAADGCCRWRARLQMEVGIEDCLHIEFEYDRARYHLKDMVNGKIYFLLVGGGRALPLGACQG